MKDWIIEKLFDFIQENAGCLIIGFSVLCLIAAFIFAIL